MNDYRLINVGGITSIHLIIAGVKYVNPLLSSGNFASTTADVKTDCAASDGEYYYLIRSTQRDLACPDGSALIEHGSTIFPTLDEVIESLPFTAFWSGGCQNTTKGMLLISNTGNTHVIYDEGRTTFDVRTEISDPRYSVPLCKLDDQ